MKKIIFPLIGLVVLLTGGWFARGAILSPPIDVIHPARGHAVQAVYATGTVEPSVMMPIAPRLTARLVELNVDEGAQVKAGDVLARLEDADVQNTILQLKAKLDLAQINFNRYDKLARDGAGTRKQADEARTTLQAAQADLAKAEAEASYLKLLAPADGTIIKRDGEIGQLIPSGNAVFWMSCCAPLRITAEIDEEDIPLVRVGQDVLIQADAFPGQTFHGKIQSITPKGDPVARSYRARVAFDDPASVPLMIGMTAETNVMISDNANALIVPASSVQNNKVFVLQKDKVHVANVKVGAKTSAGVEILSGIDDQDLIVRAPSKTLADGDELNFRVSDFHPEAKQATGERKK